MSPIIERKFIRKQPKPEEPAQTVELDDTKVIPLKDQKGNILFRGTLKEIVEWSNATFAQREAARVSDSCRFFDTSGTSVPPQS
jgi:hypothetical protein